MSSFWKLVPFLKETLRVNLTGKSGVIWSPQFFFLAHFSLTWIFFAVCRRLDASDIVWLLVSISACQPDAYLCCHPGERWILHYKPTPLILVLSSVWQCSSIQLPDHNTPALSRLWCTCASWKTRCVWQDEWLRVPVPLHGGSGVSAPSPAPKDPQVCAVPEPRGAVVAQRSQALLPLQGLHLWEMHPHHRAAARHGGAGGAPQAAGQRESGEPHPGVTQSAARHRHNRRRRGEPGSPAEDRGAGAEVEQHRAGAGRGTNMHR